MKKVLKILLFLLICASLSAGYNYSVNGKVFYSGGTDSVKGATVTLTVNWAVGGVASGSTTTEKDGSFSFVVSSDSLDYIGATMELKATTAFCSGSTTWICKSYSEGKDVWIFCNVQINPDLSTVVKPRPFISAGRQLPVTTVAYLDQPVHPVLVQQFQVALRWNPVHMNIAAVESSPGSPFIVETWGPGPDIGTAIVKGHSLFGPVPMKIWPEPPDSFFDIFFDVLVPPEEMPLYSTVTVVPLETYLYGPEVYYPYQHQSDFLIGEPEPCKAVFMIDSFEEWETALHSSLPDANIRPATLTFWRQYMDYWANPTSEIEGEPYPRSEFIPPIEPEGMLYVYEGGGGGGGIPEDAGLVMAWGTTPPAEEGNYASAWRWDYGLDPDLSNCTIQVTVSPMTPNINIVSFSIVDIANRMRTWWWNVPGTIPLGVPTTVKINTALTGVAAASPVATGYMNVPGFDITKSQFFDVDENFKYIFGQQPVPPPGQQIFVYGWNYWHNLLVTKNTQAYKGTWPKYSQPPVVLNPEQAVPNILGWDEVSIYKPPQWPIMADDWICLDGRPVTDIHWWGSFKGWTQPYLPRVVPKAFHIGIWTDVPAGPNNPYSHPGKLIWEHICDNWVWNFAGYDIDPRCEYPEMPCFRNEACFQFNQLLSEDDWFYQKPSENPEQPNIYWLSIAAIYDDNALIANPWGWKTRPHLFNDDAVRIIATAEGLWPPQVGSVFGKGIPIQIPEYPAPGASWDLAFELTTNQKPPCHTLQGDINHDCVVNLHDFAILASDWLLTSP
ncbi:MAG: hypothetical protein KBI46_04670 [Phycisphaerae bacterium]|nr:hypothetical protein [Phycisphaerae bacterium]